MRRPGAASLGWRGPVSNTTPEPVEEGGAGGAGPLPRSGAGASVSGGAPASDMVGGRTRVLGGASGRVKGRGEGGTADSGSGNETSCWLSYGDSSEAARHELDAPA